MSKVKYRLIVAAISALLVSLVYPNFVPSAHASGVPQFSLVDVRLDRTMASNSAGSTVMYTGGTVCVSTPASFAGIPNGGAEQYVDVGFPAEEGVASAADFQVSTTAANWLTNTTNAGSGNNGQNYWPLMGNASTTAWPGITNPITGAITNGSYSSGHVSTLKIVRFATGNLAVASTYCFNFKDGSGTVGAETSGTYSLQLPDIGTNGYQENVPGFVATYKCAAGCTAPSSGTAIQSSNWGTQITSSSTTACNSAPCNDYYTVSAVVPPILTLAIDANNDSFTTNLDPNQPVLTNGVHAVIQTNAKGGWVMWSKDLNQGLKSASSGGSINTVAWGAGANGTPTTLVNTTADYGLNVAVASNLGGIYGPTNCTSQSEPEYTGTLTVPAAVQVGDMTSNWAEAADCSTATPPGTDGGSRVTFIEAATITFSTPAATDYTDTVYIAAAGQF